MKPLVTNRSFYVSRLKSYVSGARGWSLSSRLITLMASLVRLLLLDTSRRSRITSPSSKIPKILARSPMRKNIAPNIGFKNQTTIITIKDWDMHYHRDAAAGEETGLFQDSQQVKHYRQAECTLVALHHRPSRWRSVFSIS